jgi:flagellar protein FlaG
MDIDTIRGRIDPSFYPFKKNKAQEEDIPRMFPGSSSSQVENKAELLRETGFLADAIDKLKKAGDIFNRRLEFKVDEDTHRIVVKVIDTETDKVIKEIPPEQIIELAAKIQEMVGLLVDEER